MGPSAPSTAPGPTRGSRVRGLMQGLSVGEVLGSAPRRSGVLPHGVATELACFTAAASIRTSLRRTVTGAGDARADLLEAYRQWARVRSAGRTSADPTAWLDEVELFVHTAEEARDTVRGLAGGAGTRTDPVTTADGWHAVVRALPLAVQLDRDPAAALAAAVDSAALTHGPRTFAPAALAVLLAGASLRCGDPVQAVAVAVTDAILSGVDFAAVAVVDDAVRAARETPASPLVLRAGAADGTAAAVLWGATYCALSHPTRPGTAAALALAATAPAPHGVSALTGALVGAAHGETALPQQVLTRVDLAYVVDRLARDLDRENRLNPDGSWGAAADPLWRARYGIG